MTSQRYVLLTACRNEENYIEATIDSIAAQTIRPEKWIIVNDGSTDNTENILASCSQKYHFIQTINRIPAGKRNFGSKADAVNLGYTKLAHLDFEFIGNLDADITFEPTYYESVLQKFERNEKLGIAGGVRLDYINGKFVPVKSSANSIPGAFQVFRRECWEDVGGYKPLEFGYIDAVAEITARMKGWKVKSYPSLIVYHHRCTGSAQRSVFINAFRSGVQEYKIGYHPLFQVLKSIDRMRNKPFFLGGAFQLMGYFWVALIRSHKSVQNELIEYLRSEQLQRMKNVFSVNKD